MTRTPLILAALALMPALALAACASGKPPPSRSYAERADQSRDPKVRAVCATETVGEGVIASPAEEGRLVLAPDGATGYFARAATIYETTRSWSGWSAPAAAAFSAGASDIDPFVSPDGRHLYFASDRPAPGKAGYDTDIWRIERYGPAWGAPERLGPEVNTAADERSPAVAADGAVYFASTRSGASALYVARADADGALKTAVALGAPVDAHGEEGSPWVAPDGSELIFDAKDRAGGAGGHDLFVTRRGPDGAWTPPKPLDRVNSQADELGPSRDNSGAILYFVGRGEAGGDVRSVPWACLQAPAGDQPPPGAPANR